MTGGGGLDAVIHRAAGKGLLEACKRIPYVHGKVRCPTSEVRVTNGADLPQPYVLHTVGPEIKKGHNVSGHDKKQLADTYKNCLETAEQFSKYLKNPKKAHPSWMSKVHSPKDGNLKGKLYAKKGAFVTFCCISTGSYNYPADKAAKVAIKTMVNFALHHPKTVKKIRIACAAGQKDVSPLVAAMKKAAR